MRSRGSGAATRATWLSGTGLPYASTRTRSSSDGARLPAPDAGELALGALDRLVHRLAGVLGQLGYACSSDDGPYPVSLQDPGDGAGLVDVEDDDGQLVGLAESERVRVHDRVILDDRFLVA